MKSYAHSKGTVIFLRIRLRLYFWEKLKVKKDQRLFEIQIMNEFKSTWITKVSVIFPSAVKSSFKKRMRIWNNVCSIKNRSRCMRTIAQLVDFFLKEHHNCKRYKDFWSGLDALSNQKILKDIPSKHGEIKIRLHTHLKRILLNCEYLFFLYLRPT